MSMTIHISDRQASLIREATEDWLRKWGHVEKVPAEDIDAAKHLMRKVTEGARRFEETEQGA